MVESVRDVQCHFDESGEWVCPEDTNITLQKSVMEASPWLITRSEPSLEQEAAKGKNSLLLFGSILIGVLLWMCSSFYYGADFHRLPFSDSSSSFLVTLIVVIVIYFVTWIAAAGIGMIPEQAAQIIAFILYVVAAWITGIITSFAFYAYQIEYGLTFVEVQLIYLRFSIVAGIAVAGCVLAGLFLEDYVDQGRVEQISAGLGVTGLLIIILEPILYFAYGDLDWLAIGMDSIVIAWVVIDLMISVPDLAKQVREGAIVTAAALVFLSFLNIFLRLVDIYLRSKK